MRTGLIAVGIWIPDSEAVIRVDTSPDIDELDTDKEIIFDRKKITKIHFSIL